MIDVTYVTKSDFKKEEIALITNNFRLSTGQLVGEVFAFNIREISIKEHLEIEIPALVMAEATNAYSQLKVPCIVEHAGLIFERYMSRGYPGGITKAMWDVLGDDFVSETASAGHVATAQACVAYCDGRDVKTFLGETRGTIASEPRGARAFYWDTVFIPDDPDDPSRALTYAEIVEDSSLGLLYKLGLSQSRKAMMDFLEYRLKNSPSLWKH